MKPKVGNKKASRKARPKDIWNSLRKLEGYLRKADIQAGVFLDSLRELRGVISLEVRREIVKGFCSSVNGDILHELLLHQRRMHEGHVGGSVEHNAVLSGIFDCLTTTLDLLPFLEPGERLSIRKADVRGYSFEEYPESLDEEGKEKIDVEVLRAGWKVQGKVVVKPTVCEIAEAHAANEGRGGSRNEAEPPVSTNAGRT